LVLLTSEGADVRAEEVVVVVAEEGEVSREESLPNLTYSVEGKGEREKRVKKSCQSSKREQQGRTRKFVDLGEVRSNSN
jgi:hypothetical protein